MLRQYHDLLPALGLVLSDHNIDDTLAFGSGIINIMVREHHPSCRQQIVILPSLSCVII